MDTQPTTPLPDAGGAAAVAAPLPPLTTKPAAERLVSLDVFRGITIAGMILVNNPGSWGNLFSPLAHATWNGLTPTDLVFPFFLFIVGVALPFSFDRRIADGASRLRLFEHVVRRTIIILALGLLMAAFPRWPALQTWPAWQLALPYIAVIVGLAFLFVDEPPLSWPKLTAPRVRKLISWLLLAGAVGLFIYNFGAFEESKLRVPGVLQRIALCYFFASVIVMLGGVTFRVLCVVALLLGYWAIMTYCHAPDGYQMPDAAARPEGLLHDWIDVKLLGVHLYKERPDPEGLLSTIPAVATVLLGVLTGGWLRTTREKRDRVGWLFLAANVLLVIGLWVALTMPLNKKIWTSSYVLVTGGLAMHFLAACFWLIDVHGYRGWARPFLIFGTNAIAVYFASSVGAKLLMSWSVHLADGQTLTVQKFLYDTYLASWAAPKVASLLYALAYVAVWCVLMWPLYRLRIFIKI